MKRTVASRVEESARQRPFLLTTALCAPVAAALVGGMITTPAHAQDPEEGAFLEEIVVTATKRGAQALQDVPIAVQAFTATELSDRLAVEFSDIAGQIPSLTFQDLGPGDKEYVIRGVNSTGIATVGVYYDEAEITGRNQQDGGGRQADIELHDLERVEVLKGPQGTLYGASSMSGTIRFVPNAPDLTAFEGRVEGDLSTTRHGGENYRANGVLNFPVVEGKLAVRAVGWVTDDSGYIDQPRLNRDNINTNNVEGGRLAVRWLPTEQLDITLSALIQNRKVGGSSRFTPMMQDLARSNLANFPDIVDAFGGVLEVEGDLINQDFTRNDWDEDIELYSAKGEYTFDTGSVLAAVNYYKRDIDFNIDSSWILFNFGVLFFPEVAASAVTQEPQSRDVFSTELRYASDFDGPVNFVVGGFLSREDKDFEVQVVTTNNLGLPDGAFRTDEDYLLDPSDPGFGPAVIGRFKNDEVDQEALYGEVTFDATERLSITGGIRYYHWQSNTIAQETKPFGGFGASLEPVDVTASANEVTFKGNISFEASDDLLLFATVSQGFRAGGVNNPPVTDPNDQPELGFDPDKLTNYEIGWKSTFADGRVTFNGALYYIDWTNIQLEDVDPTGAFPLIVNAGDAEVKGGEIELRATPAPGLTLFAGASYAKAELTEDTQSALLGDPFAGEDGDELPNVPNWQLSGSAQYAFPLVNDGIEGVMRVDWSYRGASNIRFDPADPTNVRLESFHLVNLRAGVRSETWQASLYAKNVFDKRAQVDAINTAQDPLAFLTVRPATFGLNLSHNF